MNELQKSFIENSSSFLMHYNQNHDKLGRFARSNGSSGSNARKFDDKQYRKDNPKNKGMSLMDHVYAAINKHDAKKAFKERQKVLEEATKKASQSLASRLRKNEADEIDWRDAYIKGYYGKEEQKYVDKELAYYNKYREELRKELQNLYEMSYKNRLSPTTNKSIKDIIKEDIDYAIDGAIDNNIFTPARESYERNTKSSTNKKNSSSDDYHFDLSKNSYSKEDVDLANYMFASDGDIWSKEEWARAEQILDEEERKRKKK